jgi:hypothetical protein
MTPRAQIISGTQTASPGVRPASRPLPGRWPRGWRAAAGLVSVAAGAAIIAGAFLPWVEVFAGLVQIPGIRGPNGQILVTAGALIAAAGAYQLARGGERARWTAGLAGFGAAGFSGYLLIQLAGTIRALGGDSMVIARGGPGLWVAATGSAAAFATLFFPPSSQATLRRDTQRPVLAWAADHESAGLRRGLQLALGILWLLDAALQYQPAMFTKAFPAMMLAPAGVGEPAFVSSPVLAASRLISGHVVPANAMFATVQLALAAGLLCRATARAALAGTIAWSLAVWWLGEGLGGIFSGTASPLTGAPGAAVLYAFLAVLIWPRPGPARPGASVADASPLGRRARFAWSILWAGMAGLMLTAPAGSAQLTAAGGTRAAVTIGLAASFTLAAAGIFRPATLRPTVVAAVAAAVVIWAAGEHFGQILSGTATDPNTGPLLILTAAAFWPARAGTRTTGERPHNPASRNDPREVASPPETKTHVTTG